MTRIPDNCRDCPVNGSCNNPAPYGMYRCQYKDEIQRGAAEAVLNPNKEVKPNGSR